MITKFHQCLTYMTRHVYCEAKQYTPGMEDGWVLANKDGGGLPVHVPYIKTPQGKMVFSPDEADYYILEDGPDRYLLPATLFEKLFEHSRVYIEYAEQQITKMTLFWVVMLGATRQVMAAHRPDRRKMFSIQLQPTLKTMKHVDITFGV